MMPKRHLLTFPQEWEPSFPFPVLESLNSLQVVTFPLKWQVCLHAILPTGGVSRDVWNPSGVKGSNDPWAFLPLPAKSSHGSALTFTISSQLGMDTSHFQDYQFCILLGQCWSWQSVPLDLEPAGWTQGFLWAYVQLLLSPFCNSSVLS